MTRRHRRSIRKLLRCQLILLLIGVIVGMMLPVPSALADDVAGIPDVPERVDAPAADNLSAGERDIPLAPQSEVEYTIGTPLTPDTPKEATSEGVLQPEEGAPSVDIYGVGEDDASHVAVVALDVVNRENAAGNWVDLTLPTLKEDAAAWTAKANATTMSFPKTLSPSTGITYAATGGSLSTVPTGVPAEGVPGSARDRTVSYTNALPSTDFSYTATDEGYKEAVVLKSAEADPALAWDIAGTGITLTSTDDGRISIANPDGEIAAYGLPYVFDSSVPAKETYGSYLLTDLGSGKYHLSVSIDAAWLASATYPVTVDPGPSQATRYPLRDTSTSSANNRNYEKDDTLYVSGKSGDNRHAFIRQDLTALTRGSRLVYGASLVAAPVVASDCTPYSDIVARTVADPQDWHAPPLQWSNEPLTSLPSAIGHNAGPDNNPTAWASWDVTDTYQHYIDLRGQYHYENEGIRLSGGPTNTLCSFWSSEVGGSARPLLTVTYNDLPSAPRFATTDNTNDNNPLPLANGTVVGTQSPLLAVDGRTSAEPNDINGDNVMFEYQVSKDPDCGTNPDGYDQNGNLVCKWGQDPDTGYTSPPTESNSWTIPGVCSPTASSTTGTSSPLTCAIARPW